MTAFLWVEEGGVLHPTVFELLLPEVCRAQGEVRGGCAHSNWLYLTEGSKYKCSPKCSCFEEDDCSSAALMF